MMAGCNVSASRSRSSDETGVILPPGVTCDVCGEVITERRIEHGRREPLEDRSFRIVVDNYATNLPCGHEVALTMHVYDVKPEGA